MTVFRVFESKNAGLPCIRHGCNRPRMKRAADRHSRYCAEHDAQADRAARALTDCTLAHLWERWDTHPFGKAAFVGDRRVCGMAQVGTAAAFRVTLQGADESCVLPADTRVELRGVKSDGALNGVML